jgi:uncharacterized membrane protein YphA (DoxX/SURF4 family)
MVILLVTGAASGAVLLVGFLTPVAGALAAIVNVWIAFSRLPLQSGDPWMPVTQAMLSAALAMIGPGAWSIDARRFGRKHIDLSDR